MASGAASASAKIFSDEYATGTLLLHLYFLNNIDEE
jgi:hypothetical protein